MIDFLRQRLMSFKWAFKGFFDLFNSHPNAQIHLLATTVVVPAIFFFRLSSIETCLIVLCVAFVLSMEALNSALEYLSDFVSSNIIITSIINIIKFIWIYHSNNIICILV